MNVLPRFLREELCKAEHWEMFEELRLRVGQPLTAIRDGEVWICPDWKRLLTEEDLRRVLEQAGEGSVHTILHQLRRGYVTGAGGVRIGICGQGAVQEGELLSFRRVTSLAIRLPHSVRGNAGLLLPKLKEEGRFVSTLILSPPGVGKTTLLKDLIACLSEEGVRVGVADERGELGVENLGPQTDILEGIPKDLALMMLLRGMNPQVIAMDEITESKDVRVISEAAGCGVSLLATAHGGRVADLRLRPLYRELLSEGIFRRVILISMERGKRRFEVEGRENF